MQQLQEAMIELQLKIGSRKEIMNRLGKKNIPKVLEEIVKDLDDLSKYEQDKPKGVNQNIGNIQ